LLRQSLCTDLQPCTLCVQFGARRIFQRRAVEQMFNNMALQPLAGATAKAVVLSFVVDVFGFVAVMRLTPKLTSSSFSEGSFSH